jgi:PAS domain S-box-containing protein
MAEDARPIRSAEERLQFLLDLGDALRDAGSPSDVAQIAARMLGQVLEVDRVAFLTVRKGSQTIRGAADWPDGAHGGPSFEDAFSEAELSSLQSGRVLTVSDGDRFGLDSEKMLAITPVLSGRRLAAMICVVSKSSRQLQSQELDLVEEVGARTWSAFSQAKAEIELRESEERLRDITDALPVLISYFDAEQRFQFVNKLYETWFGRPRDQIIGEKISTLLPGPVYEVRRPFVEKALAGEAVHFVVEMPLPQGRIDTEVQLLPRLDDSGQVTGIYALVQDITERKKAEEALRQSELKFRQFADQSPAMTWSCDAAGQLTYLSSRWYEYTGWNPATPLTQSWDDVTHPDDRARLHDRWAEALASHDIYDIEIRLRRYDGVYRWHSVRAESLLNKNGAIAGWLGTNSDIDDAVIAREERKRDHDRLWQISQELMVVRDMAGRIISANPSASRILGWPPDELVGASIYDLLHPDDIGATVRTVSAQLEEQGILSVRNRYRCKDGSYRTIDWRGALHEGHVHSVGRDVTAELQASEELQRAEEALRQSQKMESVGRLTGGIAHDFNNMLAGIIGSLNLLQRRITSGRLDDTARFIEAAQTSAQRAAALTQRLLAFGRRQALDVKPVDVGELVVSLDDLLRRTIGPSIELRLDLEADLWLAEADVNQLESAILNLAINARDAMPDGGTLTMGARKAESIALSAAPPGDYVELYVADTGQGMPPEVLRQAFEPFFTTKPLGLGTGLGLSMVYGFLNQIGGDARIESIVGQGTVVRLYLPRSGRHLNPPSEYAIPPVPIGAGETVLLVEDDQSVRMLVIEVLAELGYKALPVADAPSALPIIESSQKIDLMISDIGLPGMSGTDLAQIARRERPDLNILFITGYAEAASNRDNFKLPGMHLLTKPFSLEHLAVKIGDILKQKSRESLD